jgi:hypothetical protein
MAALKHLLWTIGIALIIGAMLFGFIPVTVGSASGFGDGAKCGSAFLTNSDLTDYGHEVCELNGGGANRRVTAIAFAVMGLAFCISAYSAQEQKYWIPSEPGTPQASE